MAEMLVQTPLNKRVIDDYDILFSSGMMMPLALDTEKGDTINFSDKVIRATLCSKPSLNNPDKMLPAEDITIFTNHVISIQHRQREVVELNPEQKAELSDAYGNPSKTIH